MIKSYKKTMSLLMVGTLFSSCATQNKNTFSGGKLPELSVNRDVANEQSLIVYKSPDYNMTYWEEYTALKENKNFTIGRADSVGELLKNSVLPGTSEVRDIIANERLFARFKKDLFHFFVWMRSNPIAVFKDLRNHQQNETMPKGIFKYSAFPKEIAKYKDYTVGETYVITKMEDVIEVLEKPKVFSVRNYRDKMKDSVGDFMLSYDEANINLTEKPWMRSMLPASDLPKVRKMIQEFSFETLKEQRYIGEDINGQSFGRIEAVNQYARRVPVLFTQKYFGLKGNNISDLFAWSRATQDDFFHNVPNDPKVRALSEKAGKEMNDYLKVYIQVRSKELQKDMAEKNIPVDKADSRFQEYFAGLDILSRLLLDKNFTEDVTQNARIRTNVMGTLVGGIETTQAAVVQAFDEIYKRKTIYDYAVAVANYHQKALENGDQVKMAEATEKMEALIWEALRFRPVNPIVVRYAESDYKIKGLTIPKGAVVLVATQSAMFDEDYFSNPEQFNPLRSKTDAKFQKLKQLAFFSSQHIADSKKAHFEKSEYHENSDKWSKFEKSYFHLGYGHHRCLGDYIGEIHVPEMVMQLFKLPNIKPVDGQAGKIDFRLIRANSAFGDKYYFSFPESYSLEFQTISSSAKTNEILQKIDMEIGNKDYPYEDYLTDHDRNLYRSCLANFDLGMDAEKLPKSQLLKYILKAADTHDYNNIGKENKDLLYCRMPRSYQECMETEMKEENFNKLDMSSNPSKAQFDAFDKHQVAYAVCADKAKLSATQKAFYENVFFGKKLELANLTKEHIKDPPAGYEFEKYLKFYNRFNSRESMLNFLGWLKIKDNRVALTYTRFDLNFRVCYGNLVNVKQVPPHKAYFECRDGEYFKKQFEKIGNLSLIERYYMLKYYIGENPDYAFLKQIKTTSDVSSFEEKLKNYNVKK